MCQFVSIMILVTLFRKNLLHDINNSNSQIIYETNCSIICINSLVFVFLRF